MLDVGSEAAAAAATAALSSFGRFTSSPDWRAGDGERARRLRGGKKVRGEGKGGLNTQFIHSMQG